MATEGNPTRAGRGALRSKQALRWKALCRRDDLRAGAGTLLLAWCCVALAIALHRGQYLFGCLLLALAGLALLVLAVLRPQAARVPLRVGLAAAGLLVAVSGVVFGPTVHSHGPALLASRILAGLAGLAAGGLLSRPARAVRLGPVPVLVTVTVLLALAAMCSRVAATPQPDIDVYLFLQDSSVGIVHGRDLYHQCWPGSNGLTCQYPYLPVTSLLLVPARLLTGDVRYGEVAALAAAVLALRHRLPAAVGLVPVLLVVFPQFAYALIQAWTEPLLVLCLVGLLLGVRTGHPGWATVAYAVGLASKQHLWLLLPLAACWPQFGLRRTARALALAALLCLPWVLAGPAAFWRDVVVLNLRLPVLRDSLDVPTLLAHLGLTPGFWFTGLALAGAYLLALTRLPRTGAGFALGGALVVLTFDLANKQSFFNHYTLAMALMVMAVVESAVAGQDGAAANASRLSGSPDVLASTTLTPGPRSSPR